MNKTEHLYETKKEIEGEIREIDKQLKGKNAPLFWCKNVNGKPTLKRVNLDNGKRSYRQVDLDEDETKNELMILMLHKRKALLETNLVQIQRISSKVVNDDWDEVINWVVSKYKAITQDYVQRIIYESYVEKWNTKPGRKPFVFCRKPVSDKWDNKKNSSTDDIDMRSKSELIIAEKLREYGINFEYEKTIIIDNKMLMPDYFIVKANGEFVIWEHFGKTDDPDYIKDQVQKVQRYMQNGFVPWKNLIITFDNEGGGIDARDVVHKIKTKLL